MTGSDASGGHDVAVIVDDAAWSACRDVEALVRRAADAALAGEPGATATVLLADDATLRELNGRFRDLDKPTNVLSFPSGAPGGPAEARHLGDIAIAFGTVAREAAELHRPIADHLSHLVVHGMLHLLGHDHEADAEAELMERMETRMLAGLGIADPYREPA